MKRLAFLVLLFAFSSSVEGSETPPPSTVDGVIARYVEARGGVDRWKRLKSLELEGTYAAFSQQSPFTLIRARGNLFRLDFLLLGSPAVRARDAEGPWMLNGLLKPEAERVTEEPYQSQLERESAFEPLLFEFESKGISVELIGPGDVDGVETIDLAVLLPSGAAEVWHLDAETYLEVAIDSEVIDLTQFQEPVAMRAFLDDFRPVEGLMLPHLVELEFGARLESMTVEQVVVDSELDMTRFQFVQPAQ
jgi:hypothetical protein